MVELHNQQKIKNFVFTCFCILFLIFSVFFFQEGVFKKENPVTTFSGISHTMPYQIKVGRLLKKDKKEVAKIIETVFREIDRKYNHWNLTSELSSFNQSRIEESVLISKELFDFIKFSQFVSHLTENRFDPTLGIAIDLWKKLLPMGKLASDAQTNTLQTGWHHLNLSQKKGKHFITKKNNVKLDLDGIVKGHAVDLLLQGMKNLGYANVYVNWGGDIRVAGKHPEGRNWRIKLPRVRNQEEPLIVAIKEESIATSGDYLQYWNIEGKTYCHIVNPRTKKPLIRTAHSIRSTTFVTPLCALSDALATACMTFSSPKEALPWLQKMQKKIPSLRCWILCYGGEEFFFHGSFCKNLHEER